MMTRDFVERLVVEYKITIPLLSELTGIDQAVLKDHFSHLTQVEMNMLSLLQQPVVMLVALRRIENESLAPVKLIEKAINTVETKVLLSLSNSLYNPEL